MGIKPRLGIQGQILMIAAMPLLIVTVILLFVLYRGNILEGDQALDRQGILLASQLAANLEYALSTGALDQVPSAVSSTLNPAVTALGMPASRVIVRDRDARPLFSAHPLGDTQPALDPPWTWLVTSGVKSFTTPIFLEPVATSAADETQAPRYLGEVFIEVPTAPIKRQQIEQLLGDLGLVAIALVVALGLAYWIGGRLARAIKEAAEAISRIKRGDLSVRLQTTESSEIGTLQEGVNLAVEAIVKGKDKLETALAQVRAEHEQALSQLRVQTEAAQRANQAKSMFLAKVSHEMRTPLYSIQGLGEQLLKRARNNDENHSLRNLLKASETLCHTIGDILDFTQLESGKYQAAPKAFDPWGEIETLTETVGLLAAEQGLYLDVIVAPEVPRTVIGDQKGYRTLIANLLANAIKFTARGGICLRLAVEAANGDQGVMLSLQVEDTGLGIPQDRLTSIFEPFEQLDGGLDRRYPGSGLGLSIVKNYGDAMGGWISVESQPGQGSTFTVRLPFAVNQDSSVDQRGECFRLTALVVDERPSFCASIASRLSSLGITVEQRQSTIEALLAQTPPARRADLIAVRDLSLIGSPAVILWQLRAWAAQVMSFETRVDQEQFQARRDQGVAAVLWSGASRHAIAAALSILEPDNPGDTVVCAEPNAAETTEHPSDLAGKRVLVAEDFAMNREIMAGQLREHGLQVVEAGDGEEAITLARQPNIDLILMDIQMPRRDGISAIQAIRRQSRRRYTPIIGFTASADKPTHHRVLAAGADRVLTKPISEAQLIEVVHHLIAGIH